jgi:ABC-type phosphate/phosphonate transport system substrate-binding protein
MYRLTRRSCVVIVTAVALAAAEPHKVSAGDLPACVRIGLPRSLFRDVPEPLVRAASQPFRTLLEAQTGVRGDLVLAENAEELGKRLADGRVQVGVFYGHEFARVQRRHAQLQPLVIAVNQQRQLRAVIVVRSDCPAGTFADLRGRSIAVPRGSREHCRFFLDRHCQRLDKTPTQFFARVTDPANVEDAVDDVVDGLVDAAVVDGVGLSCYERRKPGRFARLRPLQRSEAFPATVIAYRPGAVADELVQRFRAALLNANQTARGRQMLTLWKLTAFEPVPEDYAQTLADILRSYPSLDTLEPTPGR